MFDMKKMGEQIARLRTGRKYTQEQLAEKLAVSPQAVSKWENGKASPELSMLYEISRLFNCSVDRLIAPEACVLRNMDFNYEFIVKPKLPAAEYSGSEWPKSISLASLLSALKLFYGLETRMDSSNRQINDCEEYILQSAITNICFGYSYGPEEIIHNSFLIYGLDYELHSSLKYETEEFILLAEKQLEQGRPVIIIPKEYSDNILAMGFSDHGRTLKGLGFLEGDDQKNAKICFDRLTDYSGWYKADCDMLTLKPAKKMPLAEACTNALLQGLALLSTDQWGKDIMQGHGMGIYRNWCGLLMEENQQNAEHIECVYPHAFIHYENKLRTKQFFEMCVNLIPGIDKELMTRTTEHYNSIVTFAAEIATVSHLQDTFPKSELKGKREYIIDMLQKSREEEQLALSCLERAADSLRK